MKTIKLTDEMIKNLIECGFVCATENPIPKHIPVIVVFDDVDGVGAWFQIATYFTKIGIVGHHFSFDSPKVVYWKHIGVDNTLFKVQHD